jgi:hypothetical protein
VFIQYKLYNVLISQNTTVFSGTWSITLSLHVLAFTLAIIRFALNLVRYYTICMVCSGGGGRISLRHMTQLQKKYKYHVSLQIPVYRGFAMCVISPLIMCAFHSTLRGIDATRLTQALYGRNLQQVNIKFLS